MFNDYENVLAEKYAILVMKLVNGINTLEILLDVIEKTCNSAGKLIN